MPTNNSRSTMSSMSKNPENSSEFPSFHKKNISKKSIIQPQKDIKEKIVQDKFDYPCKSLSWCYKSDYYPELKAAIEFYNQKRYVTALEVFESRPPDPARGFKNLICTFHGPIGWLLMANTKSAKDKFLNFCKASCHYKLGSFSKAFDLLKNGDDSEQVLYLRAWCEYKLGKHKESKETFDKLFYLNPIYLNYKSPYKKDHIT